MGRGTTLDDPVTDEHVPNLKGAAHEITHYLHDKGVYDVFDFLLKELMTKRPANPIQHMKQCLQTQQPTGPLKVIVSGPPGLGRSDLAKRLADTFGLVFISPGTLLEKSGVRSATIGHADENKVVELVLPLLQEAEQNLKGWVLDGFPRTRYQTSFLKEHHLVPAHVIRLRGGEEYIRERNRQVGDGELEGKFVHPPVLEEKMRLHACHEAAALDVYEDRTAVINAELGPAHTLVEMIRRARMVPRSRAPQPPPRVVLLGPRGVQLVEHATRLAARLDAVLVDAGELHTFLDASGMGPTSMEGDPTPRASSPRPRSSPGAKTDRARKTMTSIDVVNLDRSISADRLGAVGVRLRQADCVSQGWVLCGFPSTARLAKLLQQDEHLHPQRIVVLEASKETCVERLGAILHDPSTGEIYTSLPASEQIVQRLRRDPDDEPEAVTAAYNAFASALPSILQGFGNDARCTKLPADGCPEEVFRELVEFVERPLPLPQPKGA